MKRLYTVNEAAGILKLHPKTIRLKIKDGQIEATRVGGQYRIGQGAIDKLCGEASDTKKETSPINLAVVSTIVDVENINKETSIRLTNTLTAVFSGGHLGANLNCVYYQEIKRLKIIINSKIETAPEILSIIRGFLDSTDGG